MANTDQAYLLQLIEDVSTFIEVLVMSVRVKSSFVLVISILKTEIGQSFLEIFCSKLLVDFKIYRV